MSNLHSSVRGKAYHNYSLCLSSYTAFTDSILDEFIEHLATYTSLLNTVNSVDADAVLEYKGMLTTWLENNFKFFLLRSAPSVSVQNITLPSETSFFRCLHILYSFMDDDNTDITHVFEDNDVEKLQYLEDIKQKIAKLGDNCFNKKLAEAVNLEVIDDGVASILEPISYEEAIAIIQNLGI